MPDWSATWCISGAGDGAEHADPTETACAADEGCPQGDGRQADRREQPASAAETSRALAERHRGARAETARRTDACRTRRGLGSRSGGLVRAEHTAARLVIRRFGRARPTWNVI